MAAKSDDPDSPLSDPEQLLRGSALRKSYGSRLPMADPQPVLEGVDLTLRSGQITGIVGENGSGKSTLLEILAGVLAPDSGQIDRYGRVGWCPQEPRLYDRLTVDETFQLFGTGHDLDKETIAVRTEQLASDLGFTADLDTRIEDLSGGNRQKVNLGVSLIHEPDVLLLDEPYTGFDYDTYLSFWELTEELTDEGTSIAIISHLLRKRDRFDRIYKLSDGQLREERTDG